MESLIKILAVVFDFFKAKNPAIAAIVTTVLSLIAYNFNQIALDFNITNETFLSIAKWINLIALGLAGSRTTQFVSEKEVEGSTES